MQQLQRTRKGLSTVVKFSSSSGIAITNAVAFFGWVPRYNDFCVGRDRLDPVVYVVYALIQARK